MNEIDAYLDSISHPLRPEIDRVRQLIATAEPMLREQIKWNAPSFGVGKDDCITLKLYPTRSVQIVFHRGAAASDKPDLRHLDPDGLLIWAAPDRGVAHFASLEDIEARSALFSALVERWVEAVG